MLFFVHYKPCIWGAPLTYMEKQFVVKSGKKTEPDLSCGSSTTFFQPTNVSEAAPKLLRRNAELLGQGALRFDNLTEAPKRGRFRWGNRWTAQTTMFLMGI